MRNQWTRLALGLMVAAGSVGACDPSPGPAAPRPASPSPSVAPPVASPVAKLPRAGTAAACSAGFPDWHTWDRKPRRTTRESVRFAGWRVTLRGTTVGGGDPFLIRRPEVLARYRGRAVGVSPVKAVPDTGYSRTGIDLDPLNSRARRLGSLCVGRFDDGVVAAVVGVSTGNNCCMAVEMFRLTRTTVGQALIHGLKNHGATVQTRRWRATVISTDWFGCGYTSCAGGPAVTVIETFDGVTFHDVTRRFVDVLRREAHRFRRDSLVGKRTWLGGLAAWVADECRLGHEHSAWQDVNRLLRSGRLHGPRGWPRNRSFVRFAHRDLRERGYCHT